MAALVAAAAQLDRRVWRLERLAAGGLFLAMVLVVAVSVIHRVFSREEGRLSTLALKVLGGLGVAADPAQLHSTGSLAINLILGALAAVLAAQTLRPLASAGERAGLAAGILAAGVAFVWGVLTAFPNGLVWGPAIALACMLWVGFLGASIATYEKRHLALEVADKIWPAPAQRWVQGVAGLLTAALCAFLAALTLISLRQHHATWTLNPLAGRLLPTEIPNWSIFLVLPYTFAAMTVRFLGYAAARLADLPPRTAVGSDGIVDVDTGHLAAPESGGGELEAATAGAPEATQAGPEELR